MSQGQNEKIDKSVLKMSIIHAYCTPDAVSTDSIRFAATPWSEMPSKIVLISLCNLKFDSHFVWMWTRLSQIPLQSKIEFAILLEYKWAKEGSFAKNVPNNTYFFHRISTNLFQFDEFPNLAQQHHFGPANPCILFHHQFSYSLSVFLFPSVDSSVLHILSIYYNLYAACAHGLSDGWQKKSKRKFINNENRHEGSCSCSGGGGGGAGMGTGWASK